MKKAHFTDDYGENSEALFEEESGSQVRKEADKNNKEVTESRIMTVSEVADFLRISRYSVYNLVKRGELPAMKILNKLRFDRTTMENFLKERELSNEKVF